MRWRRWLVVRYRAGSGPFLVSRHWTEQAAQRALQRWRAWNDAGEMPEKALIEYQLKRRDPR